MGSKRKFSKKNSTGDIFVKDFSFQAVINTICWVFFSQKHIICDSPFINVSASGVKGKFLERNREMVRIRRSVGSLLKFAVIYFKAGNGRFNMYDRGKY